MKRLALIPALILMFITPAAHAATENYGDYSRMFERSAGQFWDSSQAVGQWAWMPQSATESHINWGHPDNWPPEYKERFILDGDWVLLDGWWDNGTYYKLQVDQWMSDLDCETNRVALPSGAQRYVKWDVPAVGTGYCLFAQGTITEQSSGKVVLFAHQQKWSNAGNVTNNYRGTAPALKQTETWWDDNHTEFRKKLHRDVYLAKGHGMAWRIQNYDPATGKSTTRYDLKYAWTW